MRKKVLSTSVRQRLKDLDKQGGELGIFEELKVFNLTNMSNEQGLERAERTGWHLQVFTDVTLSTVGSLSTCLPWLLWKKQARMKLEDQLRGMYHRARLGSSGKDLKYSGVHERRQQMWKFKREIKRPIWGFGI